MSRVDVYSLLFRPGFSTKDQVDDFAGRGVGMWCEPAWVKFKVRLLSIPP